MLAFTALMLCAVLLLAWCLGLNMQKDNKFSALSTQSAHVGVKQARRGERWGIPPARSTIASAANTSDRLRACAASFISNVFFIYFLPFFKHCYLFSHAPEPIRLDSVFCIVPELSVTIKIF
jgi:hypothetical protein